MLVMRRPVVMLLLYAYAGAIAVVAGLSLRNIDRYGRVLIRPVGYPFPGAILQRLPPLRVRDDMTGTEFVWDLPKWTGMILLYSNSCAACSQNVSNWLDIAPVALAKHLPIVALSVGDTTGRLRYWSGVGHWLSRYSVLDNSQLERVITRAVTPSTILVRDGRVGVFVPGALRVKACRRVVAWMAGDSVSRAWTRETGM